MTNLKKVRKSKNITQEELAKRLNISQTSISEMEKKGVFNIKTATKYAKALKCKAIAIIEI